MIELIIFLSLLVLGYVFGQFAENKHYKSIIEREKQTLSMPVMTLKTVPEQFSHAETHLVSGSVVISIDYFKRFVAALRGLVGGRLKSYETLLDRARREAILRMKEQALEDGSKLIMNVRIETASINKNSGSKQSVGSVEVVAYGTAITL
jgi:uncharacterized protein YbjQ (UPF0145 family)